jgi:hypothetical protein
MKYALLLYIITGLSLVLIGIDEMVLLIDIFLIFMFTIYSIFKSKGIINEYRKNVG